MQDIEMMNSDGLEGAEKEGVVKSVEQDGDDVEKEVDNCDDSGSIESRGVVSNIGIDELSEQEEEDEEENETANHDELSKQLRLSLKHIGSKVQQLGCLKHSQETLTEQEERSETTLLKAIKAELGSLSFSPSFKELFALMKVSQVRTLWKDVGAIISQVLFSLDAEGLDLSATDEKNMTQSSISGSMKPLRKKKLEREASLVLTELLQKICRLIQQFLAFISSKPKTAREVTANVERRLRVPDSCFNCIRQLYGTLGLYPRQSERMFQNGCLSATGVVSSISDSIREQVVDICEYLFLKDFRSSEDVILDALKLLVISSLSYDGTKVTLKRIFKLKEAFQLLDLEDETSLHFRQLFLSCFFSQLYLSDGTGTKILVELFSLKMNADYVKVIHRTIKSQLVYAKETVVNTYADVYFNTWNALLSKSSTPSSLTENPLLNLATEESESYSSQQLRFEHEVVQDIVDCACYLENDKLRLKMLRILEFGFHRRKRVNAVEILLARIYEGVLFSNLCCPNHLIRRNALQILTTAFPVRDPERCTETADETPLEDEDQLLSRQLQMIGELFTDESQLVREQTIRTANAILHTYWEIIPDDYKLSFINTQVNDALFDISSGIQSSKIRAAVIEGFTWLMENPEIQPLMKRVLPTLGEFGFIADKSPAVRFAMLTLLSNLKAKSFLSYHEVTCIESLVYQLAVERKPKLQKLIVSIIEGTFYPQKTASGSSSAESRSSITSREQLAAMLSFIKLSQVYCREWKARSRGSAVFFRHLPLSRNLSSMIKLIVLLGTYLKKSLQGIKEACKEAAKQDKDTVNIRISLRTIHDCLIAIDELLGALEDDMASSEEYRRFRKVLLKELDFKEFIKPIFSFLYSKRFFMMQIDDSLEMNAARSKQTLATSTKKSSPQAALTYESVREYIKTVLLSISGRLPRNEELESKIFTNLCLYKAVTVDEKTKQPLAKDLETIFRDFEVYLGAELKCLLQWGHEKEIVGMISTSLSTLDSEFGLVPKSEKRRKKASKAGMPPLVAVCCLHFILEHDDDHKYACLVQEASIAGMLTSLLCLIKKSNVFEIAHVQNDQREVSNQPARKKRRPALATKDPGQGNLTSSDVFADSVNLVYVLMEVYLKLSTNFEIYHLRKKQKRLVEAMKSRTMELKPEGYDSLLRLFINLLGLNAHEHVATLRGEGSDIEQSTSSSIKEARKHPLFANVRILVDLFLAATYDLMKMSSRSWNLKSDRENEAPPTNTGSRSKALTKSTGVDPMEHLENLLSFVEQEIGHEEDSPTRLYLCAIRDHSQDMGKSF